MSRRVVAAALVALLAAGCRDQGTPAARALPRDLTVLIVVLDACRADKLGCYGFGRATTPHLDALAGDPDGVTFTRHYVQGAWTKPSVASLFTGRFVHQHGITGDYRALPGGAQFATQTLDARLPTLAEQFQAAGFRTIAAVRNHHPQPAYGFARGFDEYATGRAAHRSDADAVDGLLAGLRAPGRVFGYLHLRGCHQPFRPPTRDAEYIARYGTPYDEAARQAAGVDFTGPAMCDRLRGGQATLQPPDIAFLHLIYEARLRQVDQQVVARLVAGLRAAGRYDDTLLIITADHGEELYDHRGYAHGHALWEEIVRVPLIVKFPRGLKPAGPARVTALTRAIDLLPALLDFAALPPLPGLPGRRIFAGEFATQALTERGHFAGTIEEWTLIDGDHKLIESPTGARLYDLAADPGERHDLAAERPDTTADLRRAAAALRADGAAHAAPTMVTELPPGVVEKLRSLGYLESSR
ncbi:MAG: sulfatase family protein [Candidatus Binatia bacterium]